ncbi:MAG: hypothetical protein FWF34_02830, partial [Alphaproteobacteria bacterium]|nr:hypothetical protein [Alphaproteobacteria bacterium]
MIKSILNINAHAFAKIALGFGLVLLAVAAILLATSGGRRMVGITLAPSDVVVEVKSGDTLSTILIQHNLTGRDINEIDRELRKCDVRSLRAGSDQLVISRPDEETAPNSITLICGPWKRVEITRDDGGWSAHTIEVERDIRMVHRTGRIRDGDSFYNAARRAGMPSGIIIDVYDLLSFEIDFERDVRAGQEFSVLYEEHFADGVKAGNGAVVALSFDSLRGNVKMYRFRKNDGTFGYYDEN